MRRRTVRAYTLIEMLVVFVVASIALTILFDMWHSGALRIAGVSRRIEGEAAVRILLARIRQELRHSIAPATSSSFGESSLEIPLVDPTKDPEDPARRFVSKYIFRRDQREIVYERWPQESVGVGTPLERRLWLGGDTPVQEFSVEATGENERILFQYYRVIVKLSYFDQKIRDTAKSADQGNQPQNLIHVSTTVFPRRINQELKIEVPQEGGYL